jgi:sugar phosphate isomerase/epimerase
VEIIELGLDRMNFLDEQKEKEMVGSEHLKINLDIGHAFIASNAYGLSLDDYFELGSYIHQMHLHDNFGVPESEEAMFGTSKS